MANYVLVPFDKSEMKGEEGNFLIRSYISAQQKKRKKVSAKL